MPYDVPGVTTAGYGTSSRCADGEVEFRIGLHRRYSVRLKTATTHGRKIACLPVYFIVNWLSLVSPAFSALLSLFSHITPPLSPSKFPERLASAEDENYDPPHVQRPSSILPKLLGSLQRPSASLPAFLVLVRTSGAASRRAREASIRVWMTIAEGGEGCLCRV
jgi:hypothetical protein